MKELNNPMSNEQYKQLLMQLNNKYIDDREQLDLDYALSYNPYDIGDIIEDHIGKGKIISVDVYSGNSIPSCVYECIEYTKKNEPKKNNSIRKIYQMNLIN